jgi:hypothetical protein
MNVVQSCFRWLLFILYFIETTPFFCDQELNLIQGVSGGNVNILGSHSIGHSKQKSVCVQVPYSERFLR